MIEPIMFFGLGFLASSLLGLIIVPFVHGRAVRLTVRRLEAATPLSIAMGDRRASQANPAKAVAEKLDFWYGANQALKNINLTIPEGRSRREAAPAVEQAGVAGSYLQASEKPTADFKARRSGAPRRNVTASPADRGRWRRRRAARCPRRLRRWHRSRRTAK